MRLYIDGNRSGKTRVSFFERLKISFYSILFCSFDRHDWDDLGGGDECGAPGCVSECSRCHRCGDEIHI